MTYLSVLVTVVDPGDNRDGRVGGISPQKIMLETFVLNDNFSVPDELRPLVIN